MARKGPAPRFLSIPIALVCAWAALGGSAASAALVSVGQVALPTLNCSAIIGDRTYTMTGVASGPSFVIPTDGAIIEWSTQAGTIPLPNAKLKVIRVGPGNPPGSFTVIGESKVGTLASKEIGHFAAEIPVKADDQLGLYAGGEGECLVQTGAPGDTIIFNAAGDAPLGTPVTAFPSSGFKTSVSAKVLPPPTVAEVSPASGDTGGKTAVAIKGENLLRIKSVSFGGVPAGSFSEDSETEIHAVSPSGGAGTVDVRVTTAAGQSPVVGADQFTYVAPTPKGPTPKGPSGPTNAAPSTSLKSTKIVKHKVTFKFSSNEAGSTFLCKLDRKAFAKCKSPKTYKNLKPGKHKFQVKARDKQGELDPTPAVKKFKIKK